MEGWDPMREHYDDPSLNSYDRGPGRNLTHRKDDQGRQRGVQLYVTGWPDEMTEEGLRNLFSNKGEVISVKKMISRKEGTGQTFGFATVASVNDGEQIIAKYDKFRVQRFLLRVSFALSREEREKRFKEKQENDAFLRSLNAGKAEGNESDDDVELSDAEKKGEYGVTVTQNVGRGLMNGSRQGGLSTSMANPSPQQPTPPCSRCGEMGRFRCARCKLPYCSKQCQSYDWPSHKVTCLGPNAASVSKQDEVEKSSAPSEPEKTEEELEREFEVSIDDSLVQTMENHLKTQAKSSPGQHKGRVMFSEMPEFQIKPNVPTEVMLAWTYNPGSFFVMPATSEDQRQLLQTNLNKHYQGTKNVGPGSYTPTVKEICAAQFSEDDNWYRACVDAINLDSTFEVTYIDYGNTEQRVGTKLRKLATQFMELPIQAIHCKLIDVDPVEGSTWSVDASRQVYQILSAQTMKITAPGLVKERGILPVEVTMEPGNRNVVQVLVEKGLAKRRSEVPSVMRPEQARSPNLVSKPHKEGRPRTPPGVDLCDEVNIPSPSIPTVSKLLKNGEVYTVEVMQVDSPGQFWIQIQLPCLIELPALSVALNDHYNKLKPKKGFTPIGSKLYAAKFTDNLWYRGQVYEFNGEQASVVYLDYGNRMEVPFPWLHSLESSFCSLPFQSVKCKLSGVSPAPGSRWTKVSMNVFNTLVVGKVLQARAVRVEEDPVEIELLNEEGENLSQVLVEEGVAARISCRIDTKMGSQFTPNPLPSAEPIARPTVISPTEIRARKPTPHQSASVTPASSDGPKSPSTVTPVGSRRSPSAQPAGGSRVMAGDLMREKLKRNQCVRVLVTDAPSPDDITVQVLTTENNNTMQAIHAMLASTQQGGHVPIVGELIKAQFTGDGKWYRAEVLQIAAASARVRFVDFGNCEDVKVDKIAKSNEDLLRLQCLGVGCRLEGVVRRQQWNASRLQDKIFTMVPVGFSECVYKVQFRDLTSNDDIVERLIAEAVLVRNVSASPVAARSMKTLANEKLGGAGVTVNVSVCHAVSPKEFYVQKTASKAAFVELTSKMLINFGMSPDGQVVYTPVVGETVAAFCAADGVWYRAEVMALHGGRVDVYHVDNGTRDNVDLFSLRGPLGQDELGLSAQAIKVSLGASTLVFSQAASSGFKELVDSQTCDATIQADLGTHYELKELRTVEDSVDVLKCLVGKSCPEAQSPKVNQHNPTLSPLSQPQSLSIIKLSDIPPKALPHDKVKVRIVHANSPSDFYICIDSNVEIENMNKSLISLNETCSKELTPHRPSCAGEMVAASFDGVWYRACLKKMTRKDVAQVYFIDFGNVEDVPVTQIRRLPEDQQGMLQQAIHCSLIGLAGTGSTGEWSTQSVELFQKVTNFLWELRPSQQMSEQKRHLIDLYSADAGTTLSELLVAEGLAVRKNSTTPPSNRSTPTAASPASQTPSRQQPVAVGVTKKKSPSSIKTYKGPRFLVSQLPEVELPDELKVFVVHVDSPVCFYCQHATTEVAADLVKHQGDINEHCNALKQAPAGYTPNVGELCLAYVPGFDEWYRVGVTQLATGAGGVMVHCVDYGSQATVACDQILPCPAKFLLLPRMASKCALPGVSPVGGAWSASAREKLVVLTEGQVVDARLVHHCDEDDDTEYEMELFCDGKSLVQLLVDERMAKAVH